MFIHLSSLNIFILSALKYYIKWYNFTSTTWSNFHLINLFALYFKSFDSNQALILNYQIYFIK